MEFFGIEAKPNKIVSHIVDLSIGSERVYLPLFIISGAQDGPTLCVTAGIHGCEYASIEGAYRLTQRLKPGDVRGTIVLLPICNMPSFQKRTVYASPYDNKNLNRVFPGNEQGSFSDILAYRIFEQAIRKADVYIDLHGGDLIEALIPFVSFPRSADSELTARSKDIAASFGLDLLVESEMQGSTIFSASEAGIPAIMAEAGGQGIWTEAMVEIHVSGVRAVMGKLGMSGEKAKMASSPKVVSFPWVYSDYDGLFYPTVTIGDKVSIGQSIGSIRDYSGHELQEISTPISGTVLFLVTSLAINKGDPLLGLGS